MSVSTIVVALNAQLLRRVELDRTGRRDVPTARAESLRTLDTAFPRT